MGYRLNRLDEPVFMAVSKPLLTEFGIHHRLESCEASMNLTLRCCPCFSSSVNEGQGEVKNSLMRPQPPQKAVT